MGGGVWSQKRGVQLRDFTHTAAQGEKVVIDWHNPKNEKHRPERAEKGK